MMTPDLGQFFREYAKLYSAALAERPNFAAIMACFTPCFVGAGPTGVECGENGAEFERTLQQAFAFYRRIGARRMMVTRVQTTEIDAMHAMAKTYYRADYVKPSGEEMSIAFDVTYLLQFAPDGPKIFAFIAGDEMDAYRRAGLID